jgi:hypothetical protein
MRSPPEAGALRRAGRPGRVEDERRRLGRRLGGPGGAAARRELDRQPLEARQRLRELDVGGCEHERRPAVGDEVFELELPRLRVDGDDGDARRETCDHRDGGLERRGRMHRDALPTTERLDVRGDGLVQLHERELAVAEADRRPEPWLEKGWEQRRHDASLVLRPGSPVMLQRAKREPGKDAGRPVSVKTGGTGDDAWRRVTAARSARRPSGRSTSAPRPRSSARGALEAHGAGELQLAPGPGAQHAAAAPLS